MWRAQGALQRLGRERKGLTARALDHFRAAEVSIGAARNTLPALPADLGRSGPSEQHGAHARTSGKESVIGQRLPSTAGGHDQRPKLRMLTWPGRADGNQETTGTQKRCCMPDVSYIGGIRKRGVH